MSAHQTPKRSAVRNVLIVCILALQFILPYISLELAFDESNFFRKVHIDGSEFFAQLIVNGLFMYAAAIAFSILLIKVRDALKASLAILCLSLVVATLRALDKFDTNHTYPESFSAMLYSLLTDRQPVMLLAILTILAAVALVYYLIKVFFKISFEGSGLQIKLPGQTVYFMPIFPQDSWQKTGIELREGDRITVELSGLVSPGGLQNFFYLKDDLDRFHQMQKDMKNNKQEWGEILSEKSWPYSGPEGYQEDLYVRGSKLGVLKNHPIYGSGEGLNDECMTIMGKPHNSVFGIIQDHEPRKAINTIPAYTWQKDKDQLYEFSDRNYPKSFTVKHTGRLWLVINDVDYARWDNTGMFFIRLIKNS